MIAETPFSTSFPRYSDRNQRDVAVLVIRGANDPKICGVSRLQRVENLASRIATLSDLILQTTEGSNGNDDGQKPEPGAIIKVPVRVRQALMDTDQGSQFIVQPTNSKDRVVDGWSGSVIEDQEGPVGMLIKATGLAVRMDVIRQLIDASTGTRKPIGPGHTLPPAIFDRWFHGRCRLHHSFALRSGRPRLEHTSEGLRNCPLHRSRNRHPTSTHPT